MRSIGAKFSVGVGLLALAFSSFMLYRTWVTSKTQTEELMARQAELALEFDLAIRKYVGSEIRPRMANPYRSHASAADSHQSDRQCA
ncbi:MAG: hypothetical protein JSU63_15105 [Phycisphaerales bacterium]|nr:MAG: hypothetical protein JSU63_15105 [Phycisphaerales bacterium]